MTDVPTRLAKVFREEFDLEWTDMPTEGALFDSQVLAPGGRGQLDSLDKVEFTMALEVEFDVEIPEAIARLTHTRPEFEAMVALVAAPVSPN